jgi:hypothetical protein
MMLTSRKILLALGMAMLASMQVVDSSAEESAAEGVEQPTCTSPDCEMAEVYAEKSAKIDSQIEENQRHAAMKGVTEAIEAVIGDPPPPKIPDMTHGGVLVYFHLYKTGGSSITELVMETKGDMEEELDENDEESVIFINNREDMTGEDIMNSVTMVKNRGKVVFYNFHVEFPETMYPTLVEAAPLLKAWRQHATEEGVPFFLATVLREPLGQSLSFFNFFHVVINHELVDWTPFRGDLDPTEENFLKTYVPNRLCHLMYDDAHGILEAPDFALIDGLVDNLHHFMDDNEINRRNEPSHCDIDVVRSILFGGLFDYVGITERLSGTILPMFMQMVFGDHKIAERAEKKKDVNELFEEDEMPPLKKDKLSEATKEKVKKGSAKDQQLYEEARDRYAHWPVYFS